MIQMPCGCEMGDSTDDHPELYERCMPWRPIVAFYRPCSPECPTYVHYKAAQSSRQP